MTQPTPSEIAKQIEALINEWSEIDCGAATQYSFPTTEIEMLLSKHLTARAADAKEIERLRVERDEARKGWAEECLSHLKTREAFNALTADIARKAEAAANEIAEFEYEAHGNRTSPSTIAEIITCNLKGSQ